MARHRTPNPGHLTMQVRILSPLPNKEGTMEIIKKEFYVRLNFYQAIRLGFGIAIGFFGFKILVGVLLKFLFMLILPSPPLPLL